MGYEIASEFGKNRNREYSCASSNKRQWLTFKICTIKVFQILDLVSTRNIFHPTANIINLLFFSGFLHIRAAVILAMFSIFQPSRSVSPS
jgi:hypothetical protein